jgi:hypothetical protein
MKFNEETFEQAVIELFRENGIPHCYRPAQEESFKAIIAALK